MSSTGRQAQLSALISDFLSERLELKVEKLSDDDPKRVELKAQYQLEAWLADASRRVSQIQAVTHSLKPLHPDAKGSNLFCVPTEFPASPDVGSHQLGETFEMDVVGNAAALDVYKFLKLKFEGRSLFELAAVGDPDLKAVFSNNAQEAQSRMVSFASLADARGALSSHTLAKQIYWPVDDDVQDEASFHLLAPLYPTSLVHHVYKVLQADRFGDEAKVAREARKAKQMHDRPLHDYPQLAIQQLGGTKPQNISQLNSDRSGKNYLLASLPPDWRAASVRPLLRIPTLFRVFDWRARSTVKHLKKFLESDPVQKRETRQRRDVLVDDLLEDLVCFAADLQVLEPGWSRDPQCDLPTAQRRWLDPDGNDAVSMDEAIKDVARDFSLWLNHKLGDPLPMGDPEYHYWHKLAHLRLKQAEREVSHD